MTRVEVEMVGGHLDGERRAFEWPLTHEVLVPMPIRWWDEVWSPSETPAMTTTNAWVYRLGRARDGMTVYIYDGWRA